jgi:S-(hydroxymethyl)glutathione dehydrogenase/alcohol dehydrogenase
MTIEDIDLAPPGPGEVRVRVTASGVCHSDKSALDGTIPLPPGAYVLGHEGTGIVDAVGPAVDAVVPGDVVVMAMPMCGWCFYCTSGQPTLCERPHRAAARLTTVAGEPLVGFGGLGTFAEMANVSHHAVVPVESALPPAQLALLGCAFITGVGAVVHAAKVEPGASVAVLGGGGVGQAIVQGARLAGAEPIIAIDPVEMKRTMAMHVGATHAIDPTECDVVDGIRELTAGRGAEDPAATISLRTADIIMSARRLVGTYLGSANIRRDLPALARLAESGRIDLASMVSATVALEDVNAAFESMARGEVIRTVIVNPVS